jgi:hypothetical protein
MALTNTDKKEIEVIVRREIKDFLGSTTVQQMEKKILEMISKELKKGSLRGDVNNAIINIMKEFYQIMWTRKGFWENQLKNVK